MLTLVADCKTSREIAQELFISVRTVERHRANIVSKLELRGAHALLQFALAHKDRIEPPSPDLPTRAPSLRRRAIRPRTPVAPA